MSPLFLAETQAKNFIPNVEKYIELTLSYVPRILLALIILVIGLLIASWVKNIIKKLTKKIDGTVGNFLASIAKWSVMIIVLIAVLKTFGVETTSLATVLGATTLAIGLALQGTLGNVASGVMLIIFRPYKLGDLVELNDKTGVVTDLNIFTTELTTPENIKVIIANGKAWGSVIINFSGHPTRRVDIKFGIDYGDDIDKATKVMLDTAKKDKRVFSDPEPWVRVTSLGDSSVDLTLRVWINTPDYWDVRFDMIKSVKIAFDQNGITIPYPHQVEIKKG